MKYQLPIDKDEQFVLFALAYCGFFRICTEIELDALLENIERSSDDCATLICCRLRNRGLIQRHTESNGKTCYYIMEDFELPLLEKLYTDPEHKPWLDLFESANFRIDRRRYEDKGFRDWVLDICKIKEADEIFCYDELFSWKQKKTLSSVMDSELFAPAVAHLPLDAFAANIQDFIYDSFREGCNVNWTQLWDSASAVRKQFLANKPIVHSRFGIASLYEFMGLFYYLMEGREMPCKTEANGWGELYNACKALYEADYEKSVAHFQDSLKNFTTVSVNPNKMFNNFVFNYLYVLALLKCNNKQSRIALNELKQKFYYDPLHKSTLLPLINYVSNSSKFVTLGEFINSSKIDAPSAAIINNIMFFATAKKTDFFNGRYQKPDFALIKMEEEPMMSLLMSLHVRQPWEIAFDEIDGQEFKTQKKDLEQRIIYMVETSGEITPLIQKTDRNGNWSASLRKLWPQSKVHDLPDYADDDDHKILAQIPVGQSRFNEAEGYLALAGCDRVYRRSEGENNGLQQVRIHIEKPYLVVEEQQDGSFDVSSNVTISDLETDRDIFVRRQDENNYEVMRLNSSEKLTFRTLLQVGHIPATARERLKSLLTRIKDYTDVHSTLMDDELPVIAGDARTVVRIYPRQHTVLWSVSLKVIPHIVSGYTEEPCEGREIYVVTNADGRRNLLKRNFAKEKENIDHFLTVFPEIEEQLLGLDQLLPVVEWVQENGETAVLEMMNGAKFRVSGKASLKGLGISASKKKNNWFEVEGETELDPTKVQSLREFLGQLDEGVGDYIRLDEETFCKVTKELRQKVELLRALMQKDDLVHESAIYALDCTFGAELEAKDIMAKKIRQQIHENDNALIEVSPDLKATLKPYQQTGYEWLAKLSKWAGGACLADDMGLGKTIQAIALMLYRKELGPSLVVAPTSVIANWQKELAKFAPCLNVAMLNNATDRKEILDDAENYNVIVASYGVLLNMSDSLAAVKWNIVCLDEAHVIKNHQTKTYQAATKLLAGFRLVMTGTPVQNRLTELWSLFHFILPNLLGGFDTFRKRYVSEVGTDVDGDVKIAELRQAVAPFLLRRVKNEVLDELPEISETVRYVQLSHDEMTLYEATRRDTMHDLSQLMNKNISKKERDFHIVALAKITRLRQIPCSCSLVLQSWNRRSAKEEALLDLLNEIDLEQNGVLVFSQFTSFLTEVRTMLEEEGIECLYLDGTTPQKTRWEMIEKYQSGEAPAVFLISLKAGGVGLNLTRANYVIHLDPWWNPSIEQQATDRAYRIGQEKNVTVFHLIANNTIEEKILDMHEQKKHISDEVMAGSSYNDRLTTDDILRLLAD